MTGNLPAGNKTQATITTPGWRMDEPPKDGTPIVAVGRIIYSDEFSTTVDPWATAIRWCDFGSGHSGWAIHFSSWEQALAQTLDDEVKVDYWMPLPAAQEVKVAV